jgi:DNA-binding transcriptional regulator YiaG
MDVSNTIEALYYNPKHATMRQLSPSTIINAAESFPYEQIVGVSPIGSLPRTTTGTARFVLLDVDVVTSATQTVEHDDYGIDTWKRWAEATKTALGRPAPITKPAPSASAWLRVERLAEIQAALGLSTLNFAQVLGLSRPGLYKWLDTSKDVRLQEASRDRLTTVQRLAKQWRERSTAPLVSVANEPLADGHTALEMMIAGNIDEAAVLRAFDELVAKLQRKPKSRSQKLADAGFTRRPSARALPADE